MNHLPDSFCADPTHSAVLLVDLQVDFLDADGRLPVEQSAVPPLLKCVEAVVAEAHEVGVPIVHIVNAFPRWSIANIFRKFAAIEGSPGAAIDDRVPRSEAEPIFTKARSDAFSNAELETWMREHEIERILVLGVYADACVRRTVEGAVARACGDSVVTTLTDTVTVAAVAVTAVTKKPVPEE